MKKHPRHTFLAWVQGLQAEGRAYFTKAEAAKAYGSGPALVRALDRLLKAKVLAKPKTGFYIILDPTYRAMGSLPPEWYVDAMMRHLGMPYYVGGLSAAALHGASPQAVQEFQVMVPGDRKGLRAIRCGRVRFQLFRKTAFQAAALQDMKARSGLFKASSPEATAWDLVYFQRAMGGLDHVGVVLRDLAARLDPQRLAALAQAHHDDITARRLGWLLGSLGAQALANALKPLVPAKSHWRPLSPAVKVGREAGRDDVWRLWVNHRLELDA